MWALRRSPGMLIFVRVNQSWAMHLLAHQDESLRRGRAPLTNLIVARAPLTPMNCKISLLWEGQVRPSRGATWQGRVSSEIETSRTRACDGEHVG